MLLTGRRSCVCTALHLGVFVLAVISATAEVPQSERALSDMADSCARDATGIEETSPACREFLNTLRALPEEKAAVVLHNRDFNSYVCLSVLERLSPTSAVLADIALGATNGCRLTAIGKTANQEALKRIAESETNWWARLAALGRWGVPLNNSALRDDPLRLKWVNARTTDDVQVAAASRCATVG